MNFRDVDKALIYSSGLLISDLLFGQAFTGGPLHESFGIELSTYLLKTEEISASIGWAYCSYRFFSPLKNTAKHDESNFGLYSQKEPFNI